MVSSLFHILSHISNPFINYYFLAGRNSYVQVFSFFPFLLFWDFPTSFALQRGQRQRALYGMGGVLLSFRWFNLNLAIDLCVLALC